jgi:hypothetical protein
MDRENVGGFAKISAKENVGYCEWKQQMKRRKQIKLQ